jgi:HSP20 family protein
MINLTKWQRADLSGWPTLGSLFGLRELHHLIESPLGEIARGAQLLRVWHPALDVYEDKDNVFVKAEIAGLKKEDIDVSVEDDVLTISGERKSEEKSADTETHRTECFTGSFHRAVTLPSGVEAARVTAQYKDGILTVTLPKSEASKPKQIEVKID